MEAVSRQLAANNVEEVIREMIDCEVVLAPYPGSMMIQSGDPASGS